VDTDFSKVKYVEIFGFIIQRMKYNTKKWKCFEGMIHLPNIVGSEIESRVCFEFHP